MDQPVESYADTLKKMYAQTWDKILNHRFLLELSDRTLPISKYAFYLIQDQLFLAAFCSFLAVAKEKCHSARQTEWFEGALNNTRNYEIPMQVEMLRSLGISESTILEAGRSRTTLQYSSFLDETAHSGTLGVILSALTPCPWTYIEISERYKDAQSSIDDNYGRWTAFYSSSESRKQVSDLKELFDEIAKAAGNEERSRMQKCFGTACMYELLFWDMAYGREDEDIVV